VGPGSAPQAAITPSETGAHVLVVDDDQALTRMVRITMLSAGFSVDVAGDGEAALDQVAQRPPDVIVLDLQMPGMDGRTFYRELRRRGNDAPVIILSAFGADGARRELDAQAHVAKPFDPDELVQTVQEVLGAGNEE